MHKGGRWVESSAVLQRGSEKYVAVWFLFECKFLMFGARREAKVYFIIDGE